MSGTKVIAVFDIGKTHKKLLLFDEHFKIVQQQEGKFETTCDEDGCECDDIQRIEDWIKTSLAQLIQDSHFTLTAVNFCTYGASLMFLDESGNRLTPVYNYLKEIPETIQNSLFEKYGGEEEFCRKTASPPLGLCLNSGVQILWLRQQHPAIYANAKFILHFPQYLSYLLTGEVVSEPTSIGCHTFMWDFDRNEYHQWLRDEEITLPEPRYNSYTAKTEFAGANFLTGIGIHDSSASLLTYIRSIRQKFILVSTGTWCINMNPFNHQALTMDELNKDCLAFMTVDKKPVKSSRLFMGHIHDVNVSRLCSFFKEDENCYKDTCINEELLTEMLIEKTDDYIFFSGGVPAGYVDENVDLAQFQDFQDAYHRLIFDLTKLSVESIKLVSSPTDGVSCLHVSGGFARNEIFVRLLATFFPDKEVFTSEIDNASALGAALVISEGGTNKAAPEIDLNSQKWEPIST